MKSIPLFRKNFTFVGYKVLNMHPLIQPLICLTLMISTSSFQLFYCEKWRLVRRSESEHAFHILYKLMAGADGTLRKELAFDQIIASDQNFLFSPLLKVRNCCNFFFSPIVEVLTPSQVSSPPPQSFSGVSN